IPRWWHSSTSYFGSSSSYCTKSSAARSAKSRIGNTDLNTSCSPTCARSSGRRFICRKFSYEVRCTSIRLGITVTSGMCPKLLRIRLRPVKEYAIAVPSLDAYGPATRAGTAAGGRRSMPRGSNDRRLASSAANAWPPHEPTGRLVAGRRPGRPARVGDDAEREQRFSELFDLHGRPGALELLLELGSFLLGHALLDRLGRALDQVLGLLETEPRDRAHFLDHVDLLVAGSGQDHVELGLLLGLLLGHGGSAAGAGDRNRRGCRHAPLLLEHPRQLGRFEHGQCRKILDHLLQVGHLEPSP